MSFASKHISAKKPKSDTSFENELADLDLFSTPPSKDSEGLADLSSTVDAFASRMQKKKFEQAQLNDSAEQASRERHAMLLNSMVKIRRSLEEVTRIDLGERFRLNLEKDDVHGWPRIVVKLVDSAKPNGDYPQLQVLSHDRNDRAAVEISFGKDKPVEALSLAKEAEQKRLPSVLKKSVREYLDNIGELILKAEASFAQEQEEATLETSDLGIEEAPKQNAHLGTAGADFYDDSYAQRDEFEQLEELDKVDQLPDTHS